MSYLFWIAGVILGLAWLSRITEAALGMPKVADISRAPWDRQPAYRPRLSIIVPARNEAGTIEQSLGMLLALDYDNYEVMVVNDRSTDRTGEMIDRIAASPRARSRLTAIHVGELPSGWLGKTHAMWLAGEQASGDWLLFTDADVLFKPDVLRRALAYAAAEKADHVVVFPRMIMERPGERMMIAFFQTLFTFGHRPWRVADPDSNDHMGVGAFNLVRRAAYQAVGTYRALRMEVLDDMKLGKVIKQARFTQRNVFGEDLISIRWAKGSAGVIDNLTKNFFAILSFQWWRAVASAFMLLFLNLGPFLGIWAAHGWERLPFAVALVSLFLIYVGMGLLSPIPPYYFFLHPVSTVLFGYIVLRSMFLALRNGGVIWRGTKYGLEELRRGQV